MSLFRGSKTPCNIPLLGQRLEEVLQVEPRSFAGMDYAVALGAAYKAYQLWMEEAWHHHG
jgi:hypothetical protein